MKTEIFLWFYLWTGKISYTWRGFMFRTKGLVFRSVLLFLSIEIISLSYYSLLFCFPNDCYFIFSDSSQSFNDSGLTKDTTTTTDTKSPTTIESKLKEFLDSSRSENQASSILDPQDLVKLINLVMSASSLSSNQDLIEEALDKISYNIKYDLGLLDRPSDFKPFRFFTYENIMNLVVPLILKYQGLLSSLVENIRSSFSTPYIIIQFHNGQYIRKIHTRQNVYIQKLQKKILDYILSHQYSDSLCVLLSLVSDESLIYLKNYPARSSRYHDLIYSLRFLSITAESDFFKNLANHGLERLEATLNLKEKISEDLRYVYQHQDASNFLREKISLYISILHEISESRLAINLGGSSYVGVGYDILSVSDKDVYFIEVKSKMDLFTNFATKITRNEADTALNIHKNFHKGDYHIYLVPLGRQDIRMIKSSIIDIKIDWNKLEHLILNRNPTRNDRVALSDFSRTVVDLNIK